MKRSLIDSLGEMIYGIRWGLVPMYAGLWIAIVAYNILFLGELFGFLFDTTGGSLALRNNTSVAYLMWVLRLIDISMIGNLLVMTTVGGYSTFVKEFKLEKLEGKPRWMNGLDSSTLKIKMGMSLVAVTAIHLLQTFMEAATTDWETIKKEVLIHVIFIITTLTFSLNARLQPAHGAPSATPTHETEHEAH